MKITLTAAYFATPNTTLLGYMGETNSREITFEGLAAEGADGYKLRVSYSDGVQYDVEIEDGKCVITGSLLRDVGYVTLQVLAVAYEGENFTYVKKSNIFRAEVKESIEGEPAPIPTYEEAVTALEKVLTYENTTAENADRAEAAARTAETSATNAEASAKSAQGSAERVVGTYYEVQKSAESAATSATNAAESESNAENSAKTAQNFAGMTMANNESAQTAAQTASESADNAKKAKSAAETAAKNSETSAANSEASAAKAEESAEAANNSAQLAQSAQTLAETAQKAAETSATNAADSLSSAESAAENAVQSAKSASESADKAETAKTSAESAMNSAKSYADSAAESESNAKASAESAKAVADSIPEDYSGLNNDVASIKSELGSLAEAVGTEVYEEIKTTLIIGYYARKENGIMVLDTYNEMGYVELAVSEGDKYRITTNLGGNCAIVLYLNGEYISDINSLYQITDYEITIPEGVNLMRVSNRRASTTDTIVKKARSDYADFGDKFNEIARTKADGIVETVEGKTIVASDCSDMPLRGLRIFGKTTQGENPTPDNPQELVSLGSDGKITVDISDDSGNHQTAEFLCPNGLPGIKVNSNGNYTDEDGQQWICDEIDLERGVYVQRVERFATTTLNLFATYDTTKRVTINTPHKLIGDAKAVGLCDKLRYIFNVDTTIYHCYWRDGSNIITAYVPLDADITNYPLTFTGALTTPIETALTSEELTAYRNLHTNKLTTAFDSEAYMSVDYTADTKTYIDNKFTELQTALLSTGGDI
jgi:hypothetical protein